MISTSTQLASACRKALTTLSDAIGCRITRKCDGATDSNRVCTSGVDAYDATDAKTFLHVSRGAARHRLAVAARCVGGDVAGGRAGQACEPGSPLGPAAAGGGGDRAVRGSLHSRRLPAVRGSRGGRVALLRPG